MAAVCLLDGNTSTTCILLPDSVIYLPIGRVPQNPSLSFQTVLQVVVLDVTSALGGLLNCTCYAYFTKAPCEACFINVIVRTIPDAIHACGVGGGPEMFHIGTVTAWLLGFALSLFTSFCEHN